MDETILNVKAVYSLEDTAYNPSSTLVRTPVDREHGTVNGLWGTLEEMKAYFINSGPYKIELSTTPEEHLTLSSTGKLRVFWEGPNFWPERGAKPLYPGHATFKKYKTLTLGR